MATSTFKQAILNAGFSPAQIAALLQLDTDAAGAYAALGSDPGSEISSAVLTSNFTPTDATVQDVTGLSVIVPANSGLVNVGLVGGALCSITTGTNAASVSQRLSLYLVDEGSVTVGIGQTTIFGTGTSQGFAFTLPVMAALPNSVTEKTYKLRMQVQRLGTLSATGGIFAGSGFPNLTLQALRR